MNIVTWLIAGGLTGWAASHYLRTMQKASRFEYPQPDQGVSDDR
jgi:hypothetical protein